MKIFDCKMCGQCCEGQGGIIISARDLARLADWLDKSEADVLAQFAYTNNGKTRLLSGSDGFCIFFKAGVGCGIHPAKPDVCRAWPFFRGNLVDNVSFALAREFCPGISRECDFDEFRSQGLCLLARQGLVSNAATALDVANIKVETEKSRH